MESYIYNQKVAVKIPGTEYKECRTSEIDTDRVGKSSKKNYE